MVFVALAGVAAVMFGGVPLQERLYESGIHAARLAADVEHAWVETESHGTLAYLHRPGQGGPTVVLIHGFASESDSWLAMMRYLPDDWELFALDLPGHGDNPAPPDADYSPEALTEAVEQATRSWRLEDGFHVLGTSMGGNLGIRLALAHPERVLSLALIAPAAFPAPEPGDVEQALAQGENPLIVESRADFDNMLELVFHDPPVLPWPTAQVLTRRAAERAPVRRLIWEAFWKTRHELKGELDRLAMPVLVIWGAHDRAVDISALDVFREELEERPLETTVLEDAGHSPMLEEPERTARIYARFLESHEPAD